MKWTIVKLPVGFKEFEVVYIFFANFFFLLSFSTGKRSILAKILGVGGGGGMGMGGEWNPPSPPGFYGPA